MAVVREGGLADSPASFSLQCRQPSLSLSLLLLLSQYSLPHCMTETWAFASCPPDRLAFPGPLTPVGQWRQTCLKLAQHGSWLVLEALFYGSGLPCLTWAGDRPAAWQCRVLVHGSWGTGLKSSKNLTLFPIPLILIYLALPASYELSVVSGEWICTWHFLTPLCLPVVSL